MELTDIFYMHQAKTLHLNDEMQFGVVIFFSPRSFKVLYLYLYALDSIFKQSIEVNFFS